jgi:hypothetical protein
VRTFRKALRGEWIAGQPIDDVLDARADRSRDMRVCHRGVISGDPVKITDRSRRVNDLHAE